MYSMKKIELTKTKIELACQQSKSFREAGRKLGIGNQTIKKYTDQHGIDCSHFTHGKTYNDMIGKKYNMLTVQSVHKGTKYRVFAKCLCNCGNEKTVRADNLKDGQYISCGCHVDNSWRYRKRPDMIGNKLGFKGIGDVPATLYSEIKRSAKKRGIPFKVSLQYLSDLYENQHKCCTLSGEKLHFGRSRKHKETNASLDRIDNRHGYIEGNLQWVLKEVNMMKKSYSQDCFIHICQLVSAYSSHK